MTRVLDLSDIQGNILSAYGKLGFPKGRFLLFHVADAAGGRAFVNAIRPMVTTALRWPSDRRAYPPGTVYQARPDVAVNIAFTYAGLQALGVPTRTLRGMPDEFMDGMRARAHILGDDVPSNPIAGWDAVWAAGADPTRRVHMLVTLNAQMNADGTAVAALDAVTERLRAACQLPGSGVVLLEGHRGPRRDAQELSALTTTVDGAVQPLPTEHFGFRDAIGDPVFEGEYPPELIDAACVGQGKLMPDQSWQPLATGEFLLGHPDEAQEIAGFAMPLDFSRNGTFFAYRKLHQDVGAFGAYLDWIAPAFAAVTGTPAQEARMTVMAKMAGRWPDGVPLVQAPNFATWQDVRQRREEAQRAGDAATLAALDRALVDFKFAGDPDGARCPITAHIRRANTRDMLDPNGENSSVLNNRRRILRRGLPYGTADAPDGEHGIVMLAVCASLQRQFEFVQQQWINYGLDFNAGNDTCPVIGNHDENAKFVIPADPRGDAPPFICDRPPQFVQTRGGDYFFVPSMTSLRMIATGVTDPT